MKAKFLVIAITLFVSINFHISYADESDGGIDGILEQITQELIEEYIQTLQDMGPRVTSTDACWEAAEYISSEFQEYGLTTRYDNWSYGGYNGVNVEGTIEGINESSDEIYVVCAHYDTVPGSPGADDDASGVAAVLAAAKILSSYSFKHTIRFVAFSGEEEGLLGSHEYAREAYENFENIAGVLNADMIGYTRSVDGEKYVVIEEEPISSWITDIAINMSIEYENEIGLEIVREPSYPYSDHASFLEYGYPAIFFFEYEFNDYYHSSDDTIDKINLDYATRITRLIVATLTEIAGIIEGDYEIPEVRIEKPAGHLYIGNREIMKLPFDITMVVGDIEVQAYARDNQSGIDRLEFYLDGVIMHTDRNAPFTWMLNETIRGRHLLTVKAYDEYGNENQAERVIWIFNS